MRAALISILLPIGVFASHAADVKPAQTPIPPDFKLVARFGDGSIGDRDRVMAWDIAITATGSATIDAYWLQGDRHQRYSVKLPQRALEQIISALNRSRFFDLPANTGGDAYDTYSYVLEVTRNGKRHHVRVSGPEAINNKALLKRFLLVWQTVFWHVESPSGGEPLRWLRKWASSPHLTRRCSQPLAVWTSSFHMTSTLNSEAKLALASGG